MKAKILNKDNDNLLIEWDDGRYCGQLSMKWDNNLGKFILDSELLGVNTVLEIIKAVEL